ncbi:hypothetical protein ACJJTC_008167 [Scirpophaga incertulas]
MAAAEIEIVNPANLQKIESFLHDPSYKEIIENSSTFNSRLCAERRMRMPFIDTQTGVAQSHCNLFMTKKQRMPGAREGQVYTYPAQRWRKARRQYLTMASTRWGWNGLPDIADTVGDGDNSSGIPTDALIGEDSRDGSQTAAKDDPKEWFYDELAMEEMETGEEPEAESDEDYFHDTYANRRRRRGGATPTGPGSRGGRTRKSQPDDTPAKRGRAGRGRKRAAQGPLPFEETGDTEKPFGCELCGAKYKTRAGLTYHFTHSHKEPGSGAAAAGSDGDSRDSRAGAHTPPAPHAAPPATAPTEYQDSYVTFLNNPGVGTPLSSMHPVQRRASPPPRPASADTSSSDSAQAPLVAPPINNVATHPTAGQSGTLELKEPDAKAAPSPYCDICYYSVLSMRRRRRRRTATFATTVFFQCAGGAVAVLRHLLLQCSFNAQASPSPYCDICYYSVLSMRRRRRRRTATFATTVFFQCAGGAVAVLRHLLLQCSFNAQAAPSPYCDICYYSVLSMRRRRRRRTATFATTVFFQCAGGAVAVLRHLLLQCSFNAQAAPSPYCDICYYSVLSMRRRRRRRTATFATTVFFQCAGGAVAVLRHLLLQCSFNAQASPSPYCDICYYSVLSMRRRRRRRTATFATTVFFQCAGGAVAVLRHLLLQCSFNAQASPSPYCDICYYSVLSMRRRRRRRTATFATTVFFQCAGGAVAVLRHLLLQCSFNAQAAPSPYCDICYYSVLSMRRRRRRRTATFATTVFFQCAARRRRRTATFATTVFFQCAGVAVAVLRHLLLQCSFNAQARRRRTATFATTVFFQCAGVAVAVLRHLLLQCSFNAQASPSPYCDICYYSVLSMRRRRRRRTATFATTVFFQCAGGAVAVLRHLLLQCSFNAQAAPSPYCDICYYSVLSMRRRRRRRTATFATTVFFQCAGGAVAVLRHLLLQCSFNAQAVAVAVLRHLLLQCFFQCAGGAVAVLRHLLLQCSFNAQASPSPYCDICYYSVLSMRRRRRRRTATFATTVFFQCAGGAVAVLRHLLLQCSFNAQASPSPYCDICYYSVLSHAQSGAVAVLRHLLLSVLSIRRRRRRRTATFATTVFFQCAGGAVAVLRHLLLQCSFNAQASPSPYCDICYYSVLSMRRRRRRRTATFATTVFFQCAGVAVAVLRHLLLSVLSMRRRRRRRTATFATTVFFQDAARRRRRTATFATTVFFQCAGGAVAVLRHLLLQCSFNAQASPSPYCDFCYSC